MPVVNYAKEAIQFLAVNVRACTHQPTWIYRLGACILWLTY